MFFRVAQFLVIMLFVTLSVILKSGVSLNAVLLSVVIPNVVLPSIVAPVGKRGSGRSSSDLELETLAHLGGPWTRLKSGKVAMGPVAPNALPRLVSRLA